MIYIIIAIGLMYLAVYLVTALVTPTDSTDKSKWNRSGMYLYVDHGTGCHYLAAGGLFGKKHLIPRLDKNGKQVCEGDK